MTSISPGDRFNDDDKISDDWKKYQALKDAQENDRQMDRSAKEEAENESPTPSRREKNASSSTVKDAKNLVKDATPMGFFSLLMEANIFKDWMYGLALMAAVLKDLLDMASATGILYGVIIVITFLCSIFIALMMILGNITSGFGRGQQKMIKSWLVLIGGTTAEMLFGISFFPIETMTVLVIYLLLLSSRKHSK